MKYVRILACIAGLLAMPHAVGAQGGAFNFTVCNNSIWNAIIATHGYTDAGWEVAGWTRVYPGECRYIGRFVMGEFETYGDAENSGGRSWSGSTGSAGNQLCLTYPGPFRRTNYAGYQCRRGEQLKLMRRHYVHDAEYTWNLNN